MTPTGTPRCGRCGNPMAQDNTTGRCAPCQSADRDRVAVAPVVPPEFWLDAGMQQALAARHMGQVIRAYRHSRYHGRHPLSQAVVAGWVGLTQAQLSRVERGGPVVHLDRLIQWARVLRIPARYLWFALPADNAAPGSMEDVNRRTFLAASGSAAAAALAGPAVRAGAAASATRAADELTAVILGPRRALSAGQEIRVDALNSQVVSAWRLRQRARYDALSQLLPGLIREAEAGVTLLPDTSQEQAVRVAVHAYNAASSLLRKLDDDQLALIAADRAVRAAQSLGDPVLTAAALYRQANVLLSARRPHEAKAVALYGASLAEPGHTHSPRRLAMWGGLLLTAAVAAARAGAESEAWELMGEARSASRLLREDYADIYSIFGPTNFAIHGVQVAVELHHGRDAVRRSRHVDPDRLPTTLLERRGQFLIDVATAHVLEGNDPEAVGTLVRALHLAAEEVRLSHDVHGLVRIMLSRERVGAVPQLRPLARSIGLAE
jgi:transcriptional regulator with XRE-family HTH domain